MVEGLVGSISDIHRKLGIRQTSNSTDLLTEPVNQMAKQDGDSPEGTTKCKRFLSNRDRDWGCMARYGELIKGIPPFFRSNKDDWNNPLISRLN